MVYANSFNINDALHLPSAGDYAQSFQQGFQTMKQFVDQADHQRIGQALASGDMNAAEQIALKSGNTDAYNTIQTMKANHLAFAQKKAEVIARVALAVKGLPEAQRAAAVASYKPVLNEFGVSDEALGSVNLSDKGLDGVISMALSVPEQLARQDKRAELTKPITAGMDQSVYIPQLGSDGTYSGVTQAVQGHPKLESVTDPITGRSAPFNPYSGTYGRNAVEGVTPAAPTGTAPAPADPTDAGPAPVSPSGSVEQAMLHRETANGSDYKNGKLQVSYKGAMGRYQVMPSTARDPGFGVTPWDGSVEDLSRVGHDYFGAMNREFDGDPAKVLASYNMGPNGLKALIAKHGDNWLRFAPGETRKYVAGGLRELNSGAATPQAVASATPAENDPYSFGGGGGQHKEIVQNPDGSSIYYDDKGNPHQLAGRAPVSKPKTLKAWQPTAVKDYATVGQTLQGVDEAIQLLDPNNHSPEAEAARSAFGVSGGMGKIPLVGPAAQSRLNPAGSHIRSLIGRIAGQQFHDVSGSAVTTSEEGRNVTWIPDFLADTPQQAYEKLVQGRNYLSATKQGYETAYNPNTGYVDLTGIGKRSAAPQQKAPAQHHGPQVNVPQGAVSYLRQHPELRAQFDQKFGAGAAARILGN